jgi:hypothetical protein
MERQGILKGNSKDLEGNISHWIALGAKPGIRNEAKAINSLSYGTAEPRVQSTFLQQYLINLTNPGSHTSS